ncbi:MAG: class I SAM-dependent rRNA methyltransferase [Verrucomicrobiales bacterium]|nr:class I SAM-dependent rRNA methyltransferase [Verrucomicrobiales bacterium]
MSGLIVKPRSRIFHGHEWVYSTEVQKTFGEPQPGDVITLKDFRDRPMGTAIYNPGSQIVARRISRRKEDLTVEFFERRLRRALAWRESIGGLDLHLARLVWSEADGLPGIVVDRYGEHLVVQTLTLAMDQRKALLVEALEKSLSPASIVERNDSSIRAAEGLPLVTGMLRGETPAPFRVTVGGVSFAVDLLAGQKTGLYLDQLDNYRTVAALAAGKRVLDCFCNQGGFALGCAVAGAAEVTAVDASGEAVAATVANAAATGVGDRVRGVTANVFDFLKEAEAAGKTWDLIVLDPPSFTRNKKSLGDALRGYKEIHLRALKLLGTGGILSTYCCSHHVSQADFRRVICEAAVDAKRTLRQRAFHSQRADHPILPTIPETEYLKGHTFELMAGW